MQEVYLADAYNVKDKLIGITYDVEPLLVRNIVCLFSWVFINIVVH